MVKSLYLPEGIQGERKHLSFYLPQG